MTDWETILIELSRTWHELWPFGLILLVLLFFYSVIDYILTLWYASRLMSLQEHFRARLEAIEHQAKSLQDAQDDLNFRLTMIQNRLGRAVDVRPYTGGDGQTRVIVQ